MAFLIEDAPISSATIVLPYYGVWHLRASLAGKGMLAAGQRVTVTCGDLALSGTISRLDTYANVTEVEIKAGAGAWGTNVKKRPYRADNGVRLSSVAKDFATDTGESVLVLEDRLLGYAWTRPATVAAFAADQLGPWWVGTDGVTRFGARTAATRAGLKLGVTYYSGVNKSATVSPAEDLFSPFVPGTTISGTGLPTITLRRVVIQISGDSAAVEVMWI